MELKQLALALWRYAWLIVLCTTLAGGTAFAISRQLTPVYEASTTLLIQVPTSSSALDYESLRASEILARTYAETLQRRPVLEEVIANLALDLDAGSLREHLHVEVVRDTQLIVLTVEHTNPQQAARIANEIAGVFVVQNQERQTNRYARFKSELEDELAALQEEMDSAREQLNRLQPQPTRAQQAEIDQLNAMLAQYRITQAVVYQSLEQARLAEVQSMNVVSIVEPAIAATRPARPNTLINTMLAAIVGGALAGGGIFFKEYFQTKIRTAADLPRLPDMPLLAVIAPLKAPKPPDHRITLHANATSAVDTFHALRGEVERLIAMQGARVLLVASNNAGDGRSTIVANLGMALAQSDHHIILIDADLRRPKLHHYFGLDNRHGLANLLTDATVEPAACLRDTRLPGLRLLPAGAAPAAPAALLNTRRLTALLEKLDNDALVLFDSPPMQTFPDALLLADVSDRVLLVARAGSTHTEAIRAARARFVQAGTPLAGLVLNRVPPVRTRSGHIRRRTRSGQKAEQEGAAQHEQTDELRPRPYPHS